MLPNLSYYTPLLNWSSHELPPSTPVIPRMFHLTLASAIFNATLSVTMLYGVYIILFILAMFLLIRTKERTRLNIGLMFLTILMFAISSAHAVMVIWYANIEYLEKNAAHDSDVLQRRGDPAVYVPILFGIINCYIADAIIFWRAWVLWGNTSKCLLMPLMLWMTSIAEGAYVVHILANDAPGETASLAADSLVRWTVAFFITTCLSNFWAVCMIGYRYHMYHHEVITTLGAKRARFRTMFVLMIESGLLYCLLWLILIIVYVAGSRAMYIIMHSLAQLTGIYPTIIVVLVCLRITQKDEIELFYSTLQFARSQAAPNSHPNRSQVSSDAVRAISSCYTGCRANSECDRGCVFDHKHSIRGGTLNESSIV